jgi:hypothetical protein
VGDQNHLPLHTPTYDFGGLFQGYTSDGGICLEESVTSEQGGATIDPADKVR